MIILHDEATLLHETVELLGSKLIPALESPARIQAILKAVKSSSDHDLRYIVADADEESTTLEIATASHQADYLEHIQHVHQQWLNEGLVEPHESVLPECFRIHNVAKKTLQPPKDIYARAGYYAFDMSTGICQHSWKAIIASANLAVQAANLVLPPTSASSSDDFPAISTTNGTTYPTGSISPGQPKTVLSLCRPPGHHCTGSQAGGYCYINNIAVSLTALRRHSAIKNSNPSTAPSPKFAILDLDFHHGNGTQEQFYHDPLVFYTSIHGEDEFPYYTGSADERGPLDTPAYGTNLNLPLATGSSFEAYKAKLAIALSAIQSFGPAYLLVSLGFDTFHLDPLGKFEIRTDDYREMARMARSALKGIPAVIVLEGGYVCDRLGANLLSFLDGWEGAEK